MPDQPEVNNPVPRWINEHLEAVANDIRALSHAQVDDWRQLPYLALQSEGNGGYNHFSGKLYRYGLLHIDGQAEGLFGTFIDCANGDILSQSGKLEIGRLATDEDIIRVWLPDGKRFDSAHELAYYREQAVRPHAEYSSKSEAELREWRHRLVQELGLTSMYTRNPELAEV